MGVPSDRRYLETHEWFKQEGGEVVMGITQFAADELTDITFVDLPRKGARFKPGDVLGEIESVKATSEIYTAVGGEVIAVNEGLKDHPEWVNEDALGKGWMARLKGVDLSRWESLLTARQYDEKMG